MLSHTSTRRYATLRTVSRIESTLSEEKNCDALLHTVTHRLAQVSQISKEMAHLQQLAADLNRRGDERGRVASGFGSPESPPAAVATGVTPAAGGAPDLEQVRLRERKPLAVPLA